MCVCAHMHVHFREGVYFHMIVLVHGNQLVCMITVLFIYSYLVVVVTDT